MNPQRIVDHFMALFHQYPIPVSIGLLVIAVFLWKKPWEFLKFALIFGLVGIGLYIATQLGDSAQSGTAGKHTLTTQTEEVMKKDE